nr:hypothetical protein [Gluconobacter sp. Gdi]
MTRHKPWTIIFRTDKRDFPDYGMIAYPSHRLVPGIQFHQITDLITRGINADFRGLLAARYSLKFVRPDTYFMD